MTLFVVVVAIFLKKSSSADANEKFPPDVQLLGDVQLFIFRHIPRMFNY